jgi:hypothetical protein
MVNSIYVDPELHGEPTLEEMLADPIIRLIMSRDGVNERDMRSQLDRVQHSYQTLVEVQ